MNPDVINQKVPPQALDIERTVLGSAITDPMACDSMVEILIEDCFYSTSHKRIFACICDLINESKPVDLMSVSEQLRSREWLEAVGSEAYLSEIVENVATTANIAYYASILDGKRQLRQLIKSAAEIQTLAFNSDAKAEDIIDTAEQQMFDISTKREEAKLYPLIQIIPEAISHLDKQEPTFGLKSGYSRLDSVTTGFHPGDFIIIAGRPGMAKTSFALNVALNSTSHNNNNVIAFFSLEMPKIQLTQRLIAIQAVFEMQKIRTGKITAAQKGKVGIAAEKISNCKIIIDDSASLSPMQLRSRLRRIKRNHKNLSCVFVDYLQLMSSAVSRYQSRMLEITAISHSLKKTAKEFNIPVIAVSQLSRYCEQRGKDKRPILSDLRESGDIEQDADLVIMLYRDKVYNAKTERPTVTELIITKHRNGPTGTVELYFEEKSMRFETLTGPDVFDERENVSEPPRDKSMACKDSPEFDFEGVEKDDLPF